MPPGFTATIPNPIAYPTLNATYTATVNDGSTTVSDNVSVTVNTMPVIPDVPAGPDTVNLNVVTYTDYTISPVAGATSYSWLLLPTSAGVISGYGTTGTVTWNPGFLGLAMVKVLAMNICGESNYSPIKYTLADNVTGLGEIGPNSVVLYPNPNNGTSFIRSARAIDKVVIRDMVGRTIDVIDHPSAGYRYHSILMNGSNFVQIYGSDFNFTRKVVVQKGK